MADRGLTAAPGALLLAAFLYYAGGGPALAAFFTATLAHELGHLLALVLAGARLDGVELTAAGPVIRYGGCLTPRQEMGVAAAGPAGGLLFAALCFWLDTAYFRYAGLVALLASAFNLLPALPLDGGRLAYALFCERFPAETARRLLLVCGIACGLCAAVTGLFAGSLWAFGVGSWLAVLAVRADLR